MKSLHQALAACAAAAVLLAGCSSGEPAATGSPAATGVPSASAVAASPTPAEKYVTKVGNCLALPFGAPAAVRSSNAVVPCDKVHDAQIAGSGVFGTAGATDAAMAAAYTKCDKMARAFLKEDWRNGFLEIKVERPASATESGGERWWECLITPYEYVQLDTTLANGLPAKLRHTCARTLGSGNDVAVSDVDCATPHEAEYAGAVVMPAGTPFPKSTRQWDVIHRACAKVVAKFVGAQPERVYSKTMRTEEAWPGLRDVRCYVYFAPKTMTGSAKGTKGKGVPW